MKISRLIINNFRVFSGRYSFDFSDKQLILIGGQNGHGKSSLFDAIQWCLTGEIRRYRGTNEYLTFNYIINENVLTNGETEAEASVEVWLQTDTYTHRIKRALKKEIDSQTTEIMIDGQSYGVRKGATKICEILFLDNDDDEPAILEQTKNLSSYFSTTQLLSQDQLHEFILASNPKDRFNLMEKVLGLDEYGIEFEKYLKESIQVVKQERERIREPLQKLKESWVEASTKLKEKEAMLNKLGGLTEVDILNQIISLRSQISSDYISESYSNPIQINDQLLVEYRDIRKNIVKREEILQSILVILQNSRPYFDLTEVKYLSEQQRLNIDLKTVQVRKIRRESGILRIERKKSEMELLLQKRTEFIRKLRERKEVSDKLALVENQVYVILNSAQTIKVREQHGSINQFLKAYSDSQNDFFKITTKIEISKATKDAQLLSKQMIEMSESLKNLESKKELLTADRDKVILDLAKVNGQVLSSKDNTINQMIHDIQTFLLGQVEESCPVCGTEFENSHILHEAVNLTLEDALRQLSNLEQEGIRLTGIKNAFDREIENVEIDIVTYNTQLQEIKSVYDENRINIEKQKLSLEPWESDTSLEKLYELKEKMNLFLEEYLITYNLLLSLDELQIELDKLKNERQIIINWITDSENINRTRANYLKGPEEKLLYKIQKYNQYILLANTQLEKSIQEIKEIKGHLVTLNHSWAEQEEKANEIKMLIPEFDRLKPDFDYWVKTFYDQKSDLARINIAFGQVLEKVEVYLSKGEVANVKLEEQRLNGLIELRTREQEHFETIESEINLLRVHHETIRSDLMTDYLVEHSEAIDQMFLQISPHAIFKHVHLVPKEGHLYILMSEQNGEGLNWTSLSKDQLATKFNASLTFSSAQANVLAVCIFLSLALSQRWTQLELIGIDDPFQNMDDINVFSFIDVISQTLSQKQVMISSHNHDLVNLIKNKSGLETEKIGFIHFKSYSKNEIDIDTNCNVSNSSFA
ncbi:AAA family ATPase [Paenibacillus illinoisensis]|uniref:AAA family ATPase n=1 Tax=Paenibacillus illinoisensis TaxID=59845 RepID=UPI001C8D236E|nr:SMC family ATPase [Paenibacillus illinoisensis]MBY0217842.1 SMC family ATPase [Paenibacillus illinoisensis]